jgi:hypothetical protein
MKITLDQQTLAQAVTSHLRNAGVTADIAEVNFRYTRTPYTVFAEVELSEPRAKVPAPRSTVVEKEVIAPADPQLVSPLVPIVDPNSLSPVEPEVSSDISTSTGPAEPLFGGS